MVTDGDFTYRGEHFRIYSVIESLCSALETSITLSVNHTSTKKKKKYCFLTADLRMLTQFQLQGMEVDGLVKTSFLSKTMDFCHRNLRSCRKPIEQRAGGIPFLGPGP